MCQVLYQIFYYQGGLFGGDCKEFFKVEVGLLVGYVGNSVNYYEGNFKVMVDVGDGGCFYFYGDCLWEIMVDFCQIDRVVNEGIFVNDEVVNGVEI